MADVIASGLRRVVRANTVLRWTPWFAMLGVVAALANLLLRNDITVPFWVATMALPGLSLDLSRTLNGGEPAWSWKEVVTKRGLAAVAICLGVAFPLESVLDNLGGYHASSLPWYVNTDWSQLSDAAAMTIALPVARQFLQWTKHKATPRALVN